MSEGLDSLDQYSKSWQLESEYPYYRGIASLFVAFVSLILLLSLICKIIKKSQPNERNKPVVCKYCSICCGPQSNYFKCKNICVLPAPLDVLLCSYFLAFLTFGCNGYGILKYGNWIQAQNYTIGYIALIVFVVLIGFVTLSFYIYFYSMLLLSISQAGDDFSISRCTKRMHALFMITAAICFPLGNIMMEMFGQDFGRKFRIGQVLAYTSFLCVFLGISHLILLLVKRLEMVLVNSMTSDVCLSHSKTITQIKNDVDNITKSNMNRDAQLLQVITKMLTITVAIILISCGSGILTAYRYYWAQHYAAAKILSLARWFWFTIVNGAFGAFIIYLSVGFNLNLYKYWCRCDNIVHKCVLCCLKRDTVKKVTIVQQSTMLTVATTSIDGHSPQSISEQTKPSKTKMISYSSLNSDNTVKEDGDATNDMKTKMNNLANVHVPEIEMNNLNNDNENDNEKDNKQNRCPQIQGAESTSVLFSI